MKRALPLTLIAVALVFAIGACSDSATPVTALPPGTTESAAPLRPAPQYVHTVTDIPVLAWHQVVGGVATTAAEDQIWDYNKDCSPDAPVCDDPNNVETVSLAQMDRELTWLESQGYASITAAQYVAWATDKTVALPRKPILLTTDDGTINEAAGVTALLQRHGFSMVMFIVTQFADGATVGRQPYAGWNLTWAELEELPAAQWSFAFHAGSQGHNVTYPNNPGSTYFYPTQLPSESAAQYVYRVSSEISGGRAELGVQLGSRQDPALWAVPWNDLAQSGKPTSGTEPAQWLPGYAASQFSVIFLQDPRRNGVEHERYRLEVHGTWNLALFQHNFLGNVQDGFFDLAG